MNILFLANLVPYPLDGGGKIFTNSVLNVLGKKHTVDLVCFYEYENIQEAEIALKPLYNTITFLPVKVTTSENMGLMMVKALISLLSDKPLGVKKYVTANMKHMVEEKMRKGKYDVVFFNLLAMYAYAPLMKSIDYNVKTVLYEQNCEALIYKRYCIGSRSIIKKAFLLLESIKLQRFEQKAVQSVDRLILLSKEDKKALKADNRDARIIPIGIQDRGVKKVLVCRDENINLLFVGTLTWAPNNNGLIWFINEVIPLIERKINYKLYIVGKNPSSEVTESAKKYKNIIITGYVESVEEYYDKCDLTIVPLFIGSGQRVKLIEAFSKGMPTISTSIGAEGLHYETGKDIIIADNAQDFCDGICRMTDPDLRDAMGRNARSIYEHYYSPEAVSELLLKAIE